MSINKKETACSLYLAVQIDNSIYNNVVVYYVTDKITQARQWSTQEASSLYYILAVQIDNLVFVVRHITA